MADAKTPNGQRSAIRVLALETDDVLDSTRARRGTFGDIFNELFAAAAATHDTPLQTDTQIRFVVEPEGGAIPGLEELETYKIQAVVLSGSKYDAFSEDAWILRLVKWIQDAWTAYPDLRFVGVCFGHQILCRALGSKIERSSGDVWELALTKIDLNPIGQLLFRTTDPFIHLQQMHRDQVINPPSPKNAKVVLEKEAQVWGSTEICPVQGVYLRGRLFTCQGHPGYDPQMVREHIERRIERGVIGDTVSARQAMKTADSEHDGRLVSAAMLRFLNAEDADVSA